MSCFSRLQFKRQSNIHFPYATNSKWFKSACFPRDNGTLILFKKKCIWGAIAQVPYIQTYWYNVCEIQCFWMWRPTMCFSIVQGKGSYMCLGKHKHFTKMSTEAERMNKEWTVFQDLRVYLINLPTGKTSRNCMLLVKVVVEKRVVVWAKWEDVLILL